MRVQGSVSVPLQPRQISAQPPVGFCQWHAAPSSIHRFTEHRKGIQSRLEGSFKGLLKFVPCSLDWMLVFDQRSGELKVVNIHVILFHACDVLILRIDNPGTNQLQRVESENQSCIAYGSSSLSVSRYRTRLMALWEGRVGELASSSNHLREHEMITLGRPISLM